MRRAPLIFIIFLSLSCDQDNDPTRYTSINGYWVVRTPDDATDVTFRISQDSDNIHIVENVIVTNNGTNYNSKPIDAKITVLSANEIESITMVNNSFVAPFFVIRFQEISVNNLFTEMQVNISSFNIDGNFREFRPITATRN